MSDNPNSASPNTPNVVFERSPTFASFFTNTFRYLPTASEVTFTFGFVRGALPSGGPATIVDQAEIAVTYPQLKSFYEHLTAFLAAYEEEIGRIETPRGSGPNMNLINTFVANLKQAWGR